MDPVSLKPQLPSHSPCYLLLLACSASSSRYSHSLFQHSFLSGSSLALFISFHQLGITAMVQISILLLGLAASSISVHGAPLTKRIAQVIADSTAKWEQACVRSGFISLTIGNSTCVMQLTAGGGQQCNPVSVAAFSTLLAAPGPCEQQNAADNMIDLAKTLKNNANMIQLTQIFAQQPRNTVRTLIFVFSDADGLPILCLPVLIATANFAKRALLPASSEERRVGRTLPVPIPGSQPQDVRRRGGCWTTWNYSLWS